MSLILAIEPDAAQADAVRRAVRSLPGVDLVLVDSRDAAIAVLKGRVPELILLSALLPPGDEAALTSHLRAVPTVGHLELITIPLLEHGPGFDGGRRGLFGLLGRKKQSEMRIDTRTFASELRAHLDRIAEAAETNALRKRRQAPRETISDLPAAEERSASDDHEWPGLSDAFGERRFGMDDEGQAIEMLRLAQEFTGARDAIADRIVRLMDVYRPSIAKALRLENDPSGRLILISERVAGLRLSALIDRASERTVVPDLPAALFVMRRLLSTAGTAQAITGVPHLAIAPDRIVITPRGHVVIVEAALAAAIGARTGMEPDARADITRVALAGLSMILGRAIAPDASGDGYAELLSEASDVAAIRASQSFAGALRSWFDQALAADRRAAFPDFQEAGIALECTSPMREHGSVPLRRALRAVLQEVADDAGTDEAAIEAARARVARARQLARRPAGFGRAAEPELEPGVTMAEPSAFEPSAEETEAPVAFEPLRGETPTASPFERTEPVVEPPRAIIPEPDSKRRTLLELFRSARSGEPDVDTTPSIFRPPVAEPEPPPSVAEPVVLAEGPAEETFAAPAEEAPQSIFMPEPAVTEPEPAIEPVIHETVEAAPEEPPPPIEEAPPPPSERRHRTSILELFRSSRTRDREAEPEHLSILSTPEPEPPAEPIEAAPEPAPIEPMPEPIELEPIVVAAAEPAHEIVEQPAEDLPPPIEPPVEEDRGRRRPALLDFLRSSRSRKKEPEPEPESAPPDPEPLPEPIVAAPPENSQPLNDIFAELIEAARAVSPPPRQAPAPVDEHETPSIADAPAPILFEPLEPLDPPKPTIVLNEAWNADPIETPASVVEPSVPEASDWTSWNTLREDATASSDEAPPAEPVHEDVPSPAHHDWPAPPKKRRKQSLLELFRSSRSTDASEAEPAPEPDTETMAAFDAGSEPGSELGSESGSEPGSEPVSESESESESEPIRFEPIRFEQPPQETEAPETEIFVDNLEASEPEPEAAPEPSEIPAFVDVPDPVPYSAPPPAYNPPPQPITIAAPQQPASSWSSPDHTRPQPIVIAPASPPPPPAYEAPPPPSHAAPPTFVAPPPPPPPPAPRPYVPPPPPFGISPIGLEPPKPPPFSVSRPADAAPRPATAPSGFKGPVTRKSTASQGSRQWTRIGAAVIGVACLAIAGRAYYMSAPPAPAVIVEEAPAKPTVVNAKGTGSLAVTTDPAGARVTVDGKPRGVTPITIPNLRAGSHRVVLESGDGTVRREVKIVAGRETSLDESIYAGWVAVYAPFELQISEGTKLLGTSGDQSIMLPPGRHQLELTNSHLGYRETRTVEITPGQTATINIKAAEGIVRIFAPDGAEVWIDGERVGVTPLNDLRVAIGARDIVVRHPELGEQHTIANVTIGSRAEVVVDFKRQRRPGI